MSRVKPGSAIDLLAQALHETQGQVGGTYFNLTDDERIDLQDDVKDLLTNPALVLAALIESGWTPSDDQLRAMGGFCRNCDGAGGCMSCKFREQHDACEHDCPECGPEPWDKRMREWTFPRNPKEATDG